MYASIQVCKTYIIKGMRNESERCDNNKVSSHCLTHVMDKTLKGVQAVVNQRY